MGILFEKATKKDCETILKLLTALYSELGEESESISFLSAGLINNMLSSGKTEIYFAKSDANIIGIFTLTESQAIYAGGEYGTIDEMYIRPDYRSQKTGRKIIEFIIQAANQKGWHRIDVTTPTEIKWKRTRKFYEQNGFAFTGSKYKLKL